MLQPLSNYWLSFHTVGTPALSFHVLRTTEVGKNGLALVFLHSLVKLLDAGHSPPGRWPWGLRRERPQEEPWGSPHLKAGSLGLQGSPAHPVRAEPASLPPRSGLPAQLPDPACSRTAATSLSGCKSPRTSPAAGRVGQRGFGSGPRAGKRVAPAWVLAGPRRARGRALFVAAVGKMAPVGVEKKLLLGPNGPAVSASGDLTSEEEEGQSLWSSILSEVSTRARSKLPSGKNILVFGEDGSGKTTLMTKLQGAEHGKKGRGLEYLYLSVHDEDRDDHTRCNVWILDGDLYHKGLLKFAVSAESLPETLVIFVADMSRPWTVMESLQKWASVLREHIDKMKIPPEEMRELERKFMKDFQDYVEPEEGCQGSPQRRGPLTSGSDEDSVALPLGDNVLTHNLGIPVLVVCTKCDAVSILEKEHDYRDEHLDFIQSHLRRFCLQYGAALIYTSVKEEKNLDLLYKYIVHKTYGFHFTMPALVVEKDAVFIPAGWDNEKKIAILHENFTTVKPEDTYEDFIVKPPVRKLVHDKELAAEDEQVFLMKQQSLLAKQPATPTRASESPARGSSGSPRTQGRAGPASVPSASPGTSVKKPDPNIKNNAASEGVLASFFNSLLSKKTGSPGSPVAGGMQSTAKKSGQKTVLSNVQEELDRMTRKPDSMVTNSSMENEA